MRITYLHQYFNTPNMPGGTRSYEMAKRLVSMGHEVNMITSWREDTVRTGWYVTEESGIKVHWLPVPYSNKMSYADRIKAFLKFALLSARRAVSIESDIIFATSTPLTISLPAVYTSWRMKKPMAFEVRDLWPELPIAVGAIKNPLLKASARWLERWSYKHSEAIIALSPGMRDGVSRTGFPSERIAVIPNSCDNSMFEASTTSRKAFRESRGWLGNKPLLVYPGTFGIINGVGYLVDIAKHLKTLSPDIRILLIGDGFEKNEIEARALSEGVLGVNLFIEKQVSKNEITAVFSAADMICSLFVDMPEMRANSANKFFDTLAAGKPCVLNYGGWQADLITTKECGIVTWGMTIEKAADIISFHITDKEWLVQAGNNARMLALEQFDRDLLASQLGKVLELASSNRGAEASTVSNKIYK